MHQWWSQRKYSQWTHQQLPQWMRHRKHQRNRHNEYFNHQNTSYTSIQEDDINFVSTSSFPSVSNTSLSHVDSPPENTTMPHPAVECSTELKTYHAATILYIYLTASVATNPVGIRRSVCISPRNLEIYACYCPYLALTSSSTAIDQ